MSNLPSEFEQQLRRMNPGTAESLMPDTFYRAGWAACEAQAYEVTAAKSKRHRSIFPFVTGLACGLCAAVGAALSVGVKFSTETQQSHQVVVSPNDGSVSDKDNGKQSTALSDNLVSNGVMPTETISGTANRLAYAYVSPQSLSFAAKRQWNNSQHSLASPAGSQDANGTRNTSFKPESPLRAFPATEQIIEQYL